MLECLESLPLVNIFINSLEVFYLFGSYSHLLLDSYLPDPPTLLSSFVSIFLKPCNTNLYYLIIWVSDLPLECSQLSRGYPLRENSLALSRSSSSPMVKDGIKPNSHLHAEIWSVSSCVLLCVEDSLPLSSHPTSGLLAPSSPSSAVISEHWEKRVGH